MNKRIKNEIKRMKLDWEETCNVKPSYYLRVVGPMNLSPISTLRKGIYLGFKQLSDGSVIYPFRGRRLRIHEV